MRPQDPVPADSAAAVLRRIDWSALMNWQLLLPRLIQSVIVIGLAFVAYRFVVLLTRRLEREIEEQDPLVKRMREQRARTIASLLNNVAVVVIVAGAALTVLSTVFDIDIAPLLAGLGVFGLAISFGAQSLVKDVITGTFILVEGQFGIGDVVRIGDTSGMVERITLRTTLLRDLEGVLHIVPNGEITRVSNLTKAWSRTVVDIGVAYHEDVDRVIEVLRDVAGGLRADPDWSALILEDPEVLGIERLAESAVVIRTIVRTLPLKQWDVARELRRRIKNRFDAEGIEIPYPHLTINVGEGRIAPGPVTAPPHPPRPAPGGDAAGRP
ncbi:MAG TPA: mechanosensitive ion channel family protein [Longimicrobiales bacterium]